MNIMVKGHSSEELVVDGSLRKFHETCTNCGDELQLGQKAILIRDRKGRRKAVFCTELCARQKYLETMGRRYHTWRTKSG